MKQTQVYNKKFYKDQHRGSSLSAMTVVPIVLDLVKVRSVIDIGRGLGEWLVAFQEYGVDDIFGVDGNYIDKSMLHIPQDNFKGINLKQPFTLHRTYDLAISLEVAEHLVPSNAANFVESLVFRGELKWNYVIFYG